VATKFKFELTVDEEAFLSAVKTKHGAKRIEGGKILVVVVSRSGKGFNETVIGYEMLLQDTYGPDNVTIRGAGHVTIPPPPREDEESVSKKAFRKSLDFSRRKFLAQREFSTLIRAIDSGREKYNQIHIIGHGDPEYGLLFLKKFEDSGEVTTEPFSTEKAEKARLQEPENWPLELGCRIILIGCGSDAGDFMDFLANNGIATPSNVYGLGCDFDCKSTWVRFGPKEMDKKQKPIIGRFTYDWYHPRQPLCLQDVAKWLLIPNQLGIEEGIRPPRLRLKTSTYEE
jgi:hypothetical protein